MQALASTRPIWRQPRRMRRRSLVVLAVVPGTAWRRLAGVVPRRADVRGASVAVPGPSTGHAGWCGSDGSVATATASSLSTTSTAFAKMRSDPSPRRCVAMPHTRRAVLECAVCWRAALCWSALFVGALRCVGVRCLLARCAVLECAVC